MSDYPPQRFVVARGQQERQALIDAADEIHEWVQALPLWRGAAYREGALNAVAELRRIGDRNDGGWVCDICGCWNPTGAACKYGGDAAHRDPEDEVSS